MAVCSNRALFAFRSGTSFFTSTSTISPFFPTLINLRTQKRVFSINSSSFDPPDVARLAQTARISLTPQEVEEFGPKIQQVIQWFGQLQAVGLDSVEPAVRSDIDGDNLREDVPRAFENRDAIIAGIPSYEEPYIKVPKVLNKE